MRVDLTGAFSRLSVEDQARISIPLDIVSKLLALR